MAEFSLIQAAIGSASALLGGFAGAVFARFSEYEKWLRQERSTAFAEFLRRMHDARLDASNVIYSTDGDVQSRSIKATEIFVTVGKYESVARLYISEGNREKLTSLREQLWLNYTMDGGPANRSSQIKNIAQDIQSLLEQELKHKSWKILWPF